MAFIIIIIKSLLASLQALLEQELCLSQFVTKITVSQIDVGVEGCVLIRIWFTSSSLLHLYCLVIFFLFLVSALIVLRKESLIEWIL